tara:strand:- start:17156 stop:17740 length:585 start_codon:yes stop_codon:yes gene_type:complete
MRKHIFEPKQSTDPTMWYWWQNGFNPEELDRVDQLVSTLPLVQASTLGGDTSDYRRSSVRWVPQNDESDWLYEKLINMATEANNCLWNFDLVTATEDLQFTEYYATNKGHYDWHLDTGPDNLSIRKVSITVQWSDPSEYEGGELELLRGRDPEIAPKGKGVVVMFPSYIMHRVTPVTKGTRKSFVLWLGGGHYR